MPTFHALSNYKLLTIVICSLETGVLFLYEAMEVSISKKTVIGENSASGYAVWLAGDPARAPIRVRRPRNVALLRKT